MTIRELAESKLWKQDQTYEKNYCSSIGTKVDGQIKQVINLEEGTFYSPLTSNTLYVNADNSNVTLSVSGEVHAGKLALNDVEFESNDDGVKMLSGSNSINFKLRLQDEFDDLTPEQQKTCLDVATTGDLNRVKNNFSLKKDKIISFLEIIKFVPALSGQTAEIEELIDDLRHEDI